MTTLVVLAFALPVGIVIRSVVAQRAERATVDQAENVALFLRNGSPSNTQIDNFAKSQTSTTGRPTSVILADGTVLGAPTSISGASLGTHFPAGGGPGDEPGLARLGGDATTHHPLTCRRARLTAEHHAAGRRERRSDHEDRGQGNGGHD